MYKDITASLVAATRKVVEASSIKAANEAAQKEQSSNLSKSMRPAYEGSAPRNAQEISLLREKAHTVPKTPKEKSLAALADDGKKDVITHADVMVGRGVKKEEMSSKEKMKKGLYNKEEAEQVDETMVNGKLVNNKIYKPGKSDAAFDYKTPRKPQDAPNRKSGDVTSTGHDVKKISTGMVYTKRFEEVETIEEGMHVMPRNIAKADSRYDAVIAHAKKMGYNVHHAEHYTDEKSGNKGSPDVTIHYQRGDDRHSAAAEAIEIHKSGKAAKDKTLRAHASGKAVSEEVEQIAEAPVDGVAPGSMEGDKHMCASKVMHKEWKEGTTLFSQHAEPNEIGLIEWYDVMFDHGIEKRVPTRDLEIMVSESHMSHSKKKKM